MIIDKNGVVRYSLGIMIEQLDGDTYLLGARKPLGKPDLKFSVVDLSEAPDPFAAVAGVLKGTHDLMIRKLGTAHRPDGEFRPDQIFKKPDGTTHDPLDNEIF